MTGQKSHKAALPMTPATAAANAHGEPLGLAVVASALAAVMVLTLMLLLAAHELNRMMSLTAQRVLIRVFGILLSAIAVQAVFNGLKASGLFAVAH